MSVTMEDAPHQDGCRYWRHGDLCDCGAAPSELERLQQEIADEYARADIECKAQTAPSTYTAPVYDTTRPEGPIDEPELVDAAMADVARAVRYLDLRGLLVRPFPHMPHLVSFGRMS